MIRRGRRFWIQNLLRIHRAANDLDHPRLAIALNRKTGSSVIRNLAKRRIREFFRRHQHELGGYDYFFYSGRDLRTLTKTQWQEILEQTFEKIQPNTSPNSK